MKTNKQPITIPMVMGSLMQCQLLPLSCPPLANTVFDLIYGNSIGLFQAG